jgi:Acetyltransferase (GNAT) domain
MIIQDAVFPLFAAKQYLVPSGPAAAGQGEASCVVAELAAADYPAWHALLARSPDGSIYSQPEYLATLCRAAGGRFRILGVSHGGELAGGVALYERGSGLGSFVAPRTLLYCNGVVLRRYDTKYPSQQTSRDVAAMTALAGRLEAMRYAYVNLRSLGSVTDVRPFLLRGWQAVPSYSYVVPLDDLASQWDRVEHNLRRLVKRCETRDKLQFTDDSDFDAFYRLHVSTLGRRGVGAYLPEPAFRQYFTELHAAGLARLFHARLPDGRSIATQLVLLGPNATSQTVSAAGDEQFLQLGAHAFLRWRAFETLVALGCRSNDLTDAALNPVTHFKSQLGGQLTLSLVLKSPQKPLYRLGSSVTRSVGRIRRGLGRMVRRASGGTHA